MRGTTSMRLIRLNMEVLEDRSTPGALAAGPLVQVSGYTPFNTSTDIDNLCRPEGAVLHSEVEPYVAVSPHDPNHIVGLWQQDRYTGGGSRNLLAAVSFDGGTTWRQVIVPGISTCSGGPYTSATDPWLSFAPNGDLYLSSVSGDVGTHAVLVSKSTDGGLTWSGVPTPLNPSSTVFGIGAPANDKESILADPYDANFAYAVWLLVPSQSNTTVEMFSRTTDGGRTWEPARVIYAPHLTNPVDDGQVGYQVDGPQLLVLPDGTLLNFFSEWRTNPAEPGAPETVTLSLLRSTDRGLTWQGQADEPGTPISIAAMLSRGVTNPDAPNDPDHNIRTAAVPGVAHHFDVAIDPRNGHLYAVWQDPVVSGGCYDAVAFTMSTDGGLTWTDPIQVNQTPTDIPEANRQAFVPSVEVAADGTVAVTYYDFRFNDADAGLLTDYWAVHAHPEKDGGLTNPGAWKKELRLTNTSFDMEQAPLTGTGFMVGEYQGLAAAGNDFVAFFAMPHRSSDSAIFPAGWDPGSIFFRRFGRPPAQDPAVRAFNLNIGQSVFWDGEYIEQAVVAPIIRTGDAELEATALGEHFDYRISILEAGAHQLRVALDGILGNFRGGADPLWDPSSTFRLQILQDRDGDGRLEQLATDFTFLNDYSVEVFLTNPAPGEYIVRVTPTAVSDRGFRMRAKLEAAPRVLEEPRLLLPNLRITPAFELNFITPTTTFAPGVWVPGQPAASLMADELIDTDHPPATKIGLRFSAGVENAGLGPLWIIHSTAGTPEEIVLRKPAHQEVLRSDGAVYVRGGDGHWHLKGTTEPQSAGEFELHATHGHYHYQHIYTYQLWSVVNPEARNQQDAGMVQVGDGHKLGFEPADERMVDWHRFYQAPVFSQRRDDGATLSAGWADIYEWNRSGQFVDFPVDADGTPRAGYYLIRGIADADDKLVESNERDNVSYTYLRVENTATGPKITVLERGYGSDPWDRRKIVDQPFGSSPDPDELILGPVTIDESDVQLGSSTAAIIPEHNPDTMTGVSSLFPSVEVFLALPPSTTELFDSEPLIPTPEPEPVPSVLTHSGLSQTNWADTLLGVAIGAIPESPENATSVWWPDALLQLDPSLI